MTGIVTPRLGKNSVLYRNTGSYASPTIATVRNVKDLKVPNSLGEDDVSARITGGFEAMVTTLFKVGISWTMFADDGADITAIRTAYYAQSVVEFFVMNGALTDTNARGLRITCLIKKFEESQGNDKAVTYDVEVGPTWPDTTTVGTPTAAPVVGGSSWTVAS